MEGAAAFQPGISIAEVAMRGKRRATGSSWWRRLIMFAADCETYQAPAIHMSMESHMERNMQASVHSTVLSYIMCLCGFHVFL